MLIDTGLELILVCFWFAGCYTFYFNGLRWIVLVVGVIWLFVIAFDGFWMCLCIVYRL